MSELMTYRDLLPDQACREPGNPFWDQLVVPLTPKPYTVVDLVTDVRTALVDIWTGIVETVSSAVSWLDSLGLMPQPEDRPHPGITDRRLRTQVLRADRRAARRARRRR